ncbi:hypothetical protein AALP_AA1G239800 [Arabis alpina]|uniref:Late embryogenesis abundant protein LEA-2 subgroup domain-containing protein n=1 Tax=Arabis alpina TaxID=50452 RepID=A0A087HQ96_ARAAL|nr:hypothetical protein AALP_AA1G239800 [Arabis alpina]
MQHDPNPRPATGYPYPYPYPNPPQQQAAATASTTGYPYQNHNPDYPPQDHPCVVLARRICFVFMALLITLALIFIIFSLVVPPQSPYVYINSLSLSNFNVSNNQLSGKWDLNLLFHNPNSKWTSLHYDTSLCSVYYDRVSLSDTRLPPFDQRKRDETRFNVTLSVSGTYLEGELADSIAKERASKGNVDFNLTMVSRITFRYGAFHRSRYLRVYCSDVAFAVPATSSSGNMVGFSKRCKS